MNEQHDNAVQQLNELAQKMHSLTGSHQDTEHAHWEADDVLLEALKVIGVVVPDFRKSIETIVVSYDIVEKWYA